MSELIRSEIGSLRDPVLAKDLVDGLRVLSGNVMSHMDFNAQSVGSGFSNVVTEIIKGFDLGTLSGATGEKITDVFMQFLKSFDTSKISEETGEKLTHTLSSLLGSFDSTKLSGDAGEKINDAMKAFLDALDVSDAATRLGEEYKEGLKGFSSEAGEGVKIAIHNTVGEAATAVSWSVLPHLALSALVTTALPLTLYYIYYKAKYNIGRPKLATEIRQYNLFTSAMDALWSPKKTKPIYKEEISRRITDLTSSVNNIRKNNGYFQNVLFYGPGGTGKTMISEFIARNSGMSYIKMSGGDLAQYIKRGEHVSELNKLLDKMESSSSPWSNRPWILFIDEAESLCRDRSKVPSAELLELQNAFLNRTGTQSKKFMLILSTNRMEDLDEAVLSRMDHKIFIGSPEEKERKDIIASYVPQFFSKAEQEQFFTEEEVARMAARTAGLTGRALFKLLNAMAGKKAATSDCKLTKEIIDLTIKDIMDQEAEVARRRELKELGERLNRPAALEGATPAEPSKPTDWYGLLKAQWQKLSADLHQRFPLRTRS